MKKTLLSVIVIAMACSALYAQPVLTAATSNPVIGDEFLGHSCDTTGISTGPGGTALTWNYAALTTINVDTSAYLACSATPACDSFPGSNLVFVNNTGGGFSLTYEIASVADLQVIGGGLYPPLLHYSDPRVIMFYPAGYDSTHNDTFALRNVDTVVSYTVLGISSAVCDAYGTLELPTGTFTNVLRIHTVSTFLDSIIVTAASFDTLIVSAGRSESYSWYQAGFHSPLLTIGSDTSGGAGLHVTSVEYFTASPPLSVNNTINKATTLQVYPNPAYSVINLKFNLTDNKGAAITITDMLGRVVYAIAGDKMHIGINDLTFPVSGLPEGMYIVNLQSTQGSINQKVIISR